MPPIVTTIEIDRPPEDVFGYVTDPVKMPEWQAGCIRGRMDGGQTGIGAHCITTRRIGGSQREVVTEITEFAPPTRWADHGTDGPIRAIVGVTIEAIESDRSRLTIELDFEGHGIGKLLVPLVVRPQARREMPQNIQALRQRLERL